MESAEQKAAREKKEAEAKAKADKAAAESASNPPEVNETPAKSKVDKWKEDLSPKLLNALSDDGYKPEAVLAVHTYKEQKLWRCTTNDGQRHEISFSGKWISDTKAEKKKKKKERDKAARDAAQGN